MTEAKKILINKHTTISNDAPFTLIAGPCTLESKDHGLMMATKIKEICSDLNINYIFKASFDKANRTSLSSSRGVGIDKGLEIFQEIKKELGVPLISDVHEASQCSEVGEVVDILQIPAFLSRQTDLLLAAGKSKRTINIKKGQFMAPWDMSNAVKKIESTGNDKIMLCERGTSFGYNTLVCDFRGLNIMSNEGYPIIFDATHSVQSPSGQGGSTGGQREYAGYLARAAVSLGVAGLFIETHNDPDKAPSDGPNMIPLKHLKEILTMLKKFDTLAKQVPYDCHKYKSY